MNELVIKPVKRYTIAKHTAIIPTVSFPFPISLPSG